MSHGLRGRRHACPLTLSVFLPAAKYDPHAMCFCTISEHPHHILALLPCIVAKLVPQVLRTTWPAQCYSLSMEKACTVLEIVSWVSPALLSSTSATCCPSRYPSPLFPLPLTSCSETRTHDTQQISHRPGARSGLLADRVRRPQWWDLEQPELTVLA